MKDMEQRDSEKSMACVQALYNAIRVMRYTRHDRICGEDFSRLDFGNVTIAGISFSLENEPKTIFTNCRLSEFNLFGGHSGEVTSLTWSNDGRRIASGGKDGKIIIWDVESFLVIHYIDAHESDVNALAFSSDIKYLLSASSDKTIKLWNVESGKCIKSIINRSSVKSIAFSPDQQLCLAGYQNSTAKLWDLKRGKCLKTMKGHGFQVSAVAFSPNGEYLLTGTNRKTLLWKMSKRKCINVFEGYVDYIRAVLFTDAYNEFAIPISEISLFWKVSAMRFGWLFYGPYPATIAFSPDGRFFMIDSINKYYINGISMEEIEPSDRLSRTSLAVSPNQKTSISGTYGQLELWDLDKKIAIKIIKGYGNKIKFIDISRDGRYCLTLSENNIVRMWDVKRCMFLKNVYSSISSIEKAFISYDCNYVIVVEEDINDDYRLLVININQRKVIKSYEHYTFVKFLKDERSFFAYDRLSHNEKLIICDYNNLVGIATNKEIATNEKIECDVDSVSCRIEASVISEDNNYMATVMHVKSNIIGAIVDLNNNCCIRTFNGDKYRKRFNRTAWDRYTNITGGNTKEYDYTEYYDVAISNDNKTCITVSDDSDAMVWDVANGKHIATLSKHTEKITKVKFLDDGKYCLTGSLDFTARIWDVRKGKCKKVFKIPAEANAEIFWYFPLCVVAYDYHFKIYRLNIENSMFRDNISLINTFYNIDDIDLKNCSFKNGDLSQEAAKIICQFGGII